MNTTPKTGKQANWVGLALAVVAAGATYFWVGRQAGTPRTSVDGDATAPSDAPVPSPNGAVPSPNGATTSSTTPNAPPASTLAAPTSSGTPGASPSTPARPLDWTEIDALIVSDPDAALVWIAAVTPEHESEAQRLKTLEVRALVAAKRIGKARGQAAAYYEKWPTGPDVAAIERLTGVHPTTR